MSLIDDVEASIRYWIEPEPEWTKESDEGFVWWPSNLWQKVKLTEVNVDREVVRAEVLSLLLSDVPFNEESLKGIAVLNSLSATSAYSLYKNGNVTLSLCAYCTRKNASWMPALLGASVVLQASIAHSNASAYAHLLKGKVVEIPAPRGHRQEASTCAITMAAALKEQAEDSPLSLDLQLDALRLLLGRSNLRFQEAEDSLLISLPETHGNASLTVDHATEHPALGPGTLLLLQFPEPFESAPGATLANGLNQLETFDPATALTFFGSWCFQEPTLSFVTFVPNAISASERLLVSLALNHIQRAKDRPRLLQLARAESELVT